MKGAPHCRLVIPGISLRGSRSAKENILGVARDRGNIMGVAKDRVTTDGELCKKSFK